jgi:chemotaxis protein CheD
VNAQSNTIVVGIADIQVTDKAGAVLITHALGSCIAVILYDPKCRIGGMIHYMLPLSQIAPDKAKANPAMFGDTGIPFLFERMYALGAKKESIVVKAAGGGQFYNDNANFNIGNRNYTVMRKLFWKNNVLIAAEDVGGTKSRTARLYMNDGRVTVTSHEGVLEL